MSTEVERVLNAIDWQAGKIMELYCVGKLTRQDVEKICSRLIAESIVLTEMLVADEQ